MRLWEVEKGACLHTLHKHRDPVYSIAFSPDGKLIASASVDMWLYVWSTQVGNVYVKKERVVSFFFMLTHTHSLSLSPTKQDGSLVRQYKGASGVFEVGWSKAGDKLAACYSNNTVCLSTLYMSLSCSGLRLLNTLAYYATEESYQASPRNVYLITIVNLLNSKLMILF